MSEAIPALILGALYAWGVRRARRPWPWARGAAFAVGCAVLVVALGVLDDARLPVHMAQHLLVGVLAPLLIALGTPVRLGLAALPGGPCRTLARTLHHPVARTLAHPVTATAVAVAVLFAVHLTGLFDLAARDGAVHGLEHAALFWSGLLAWMAILGVDPLPHTPGAIGALAAISAVMTGMTAVGVVLADASHTRYASVPSLADQHDGGTVMWLGGVLLLVPVAVAISLWALEREERRQRRREAHT